MWVFGYGSLMWDGWEQKLGGTHVDRAVLANYRRSFNKKSTRNWGTSVAPGPTLGLEPSQNAVCTGTAFEFPEEQRVAVEKVLRGREGASFVLVELPVRLPDGREVRALTPVNDRTDRTYVGSIPMARRAEMARTARGRDGACAKYVRNIHEKLVLLGIVDTDVEEFATLVGETQVTPSPAANEMLREKLQKMTEVEHVAEHPALLDEVSRNYPNTVVLLDSPHPLRRYTCVMQVFDFTEKPEYVALAARGFNRVFAGGAFVYWLLDNGLLDEVAPSEAQAGDIVLYFNDEGHFKHAGLSLGNNRVISKWGTGHLFEHELFEVPETYGTKVRFFKKLPYDVAYKHFRSFAEENGMLLQDAP